MCRRHMWFVILFAAFLFGGVLHEVKADTSGPNTDQILLFIQGFRTGGCDLNADGRTGIADLLLAVGDGFSRCFFNEFLSANGDPANPLALVVGRPPQVLSVYGVKDSLGNLVRATSMIISGTTGNLLEVDFDIQERPTDLIGGEFNLLAQYTSSSAFTFSGMAGGEVVSGVADFARIPEDFLKNLSGSGAKRNYDDASQYCFDQQKILQTAIFNVDPFFFGAAETQASHMILSFILTDEELFPSENTETCDCLLRALVDENENPHDDDRVRQISGFNLAATPLMAFHLKTMALLDDCEAHPEIYKCKDIDKTALRESLEKTKKCLQFLALMANAVFLELAADTPQCKGEITFQDPNLEAAVRKEICKPEGEILQGDMDILTSLQARYKNIQNLQGLQHATKLIDLDLQHNQVQDLGPLAGLSKLFTLNMSYNQIADLSPLQNLTHLDMLGLHNNPLTSLTPLANLTSLTSLDVGNCGLTSLSGVENLINLHELDIRENNIGSLGTLTNLVKIRKLDARRTGISDLSPLAGMTNLLTLYAHGDKILSVPYQNYITSVDPLQGLKKLNFVGLPGNLITDLTGLVNNLDFATNDQLTIYSNPLSENARNVQIPALRARGVSVDFY